MNNYVGVLAEIEQAYKEFYDSEHFSVETNLLGYVAPYKTPYGLNVVDDYSNDIGEQCYLIFEWKEKLYKLPYSYKSHYGSDYWGDGSDILEVKAKTVEKVIYE